MKTSNLIFKNKEELIDEALKSKTFKLIKVGVVVMGGIYLFGYIFKILAFTNSNYQLLKNSFHNQN
ncbi:hypothetical protein [Lutibacter sp.]|uniref:hypothetical protein n=1 Tax=Lutibacter sp. TaxID=1925666 RepID=UPI0025BAD069|nr:hypothetical protein [Lutibacter sp.]MCF6180503.1 hypothetical protein [Lutibacter sp.]